jgi:hypothetical protein
MTKLLNITSFLLEHEKGTTIVCSYVNLLPPVKITVCKVYIFFEQIQRYVHAWAQPFHKVSEKLHEISEHKFFIEDTNAL